MSRAGGPGRIGRRSSIAFLVVIIAVASLLVVFVPLAGQPARSSGTAPPPGPVPQAVDPQFEPSILASPNPVEDGWFGLSVALTSSVAVVGAPGESVYIEGESSPAVGAGRAYVESLTTGAVVALAAPDPQSAGLFGSSVAADGNLVAVGAPGEFVEGATTAGAVYLFNDSGGLLATYTSPNAQAYGRFGNSVALGAGYLLVGAPDESNSGAGLANCGNAYLIDVQSGQVRQLSSPFPQSSGLFGFSVSVSGGLALVGAPGEQVEGIAEAGDAYVFSLQTGNEILAYTNPSPVFGDDFGFSVAINGSVSVIGVPGTTRGNVYEYNLLTNTSSNFASFLSSGVDDFGWSVALDGQTVLVGAPNTLVPEVGRAGTAYLFSESSGALLSSNLSAPAWPYQGAFGDSVAEADGLVLVGAPQANASALAEAGQAYLFDQLPLTLTSPSAISSGMLGVSVAISDGVAVVGAPGETADGNVSAGHVYVLPIDASSSLAVMELTSPSPTVNGEFGRSVAIAGGIIAVGAPGESADGYQGSGNVYLFNASTGALLRTIPSPVAGPPPVPDYGDSVAVNSSWVVVGAPSADVGIDVLDAGEVFLFNATNGALVSTIQSPNPTDGGNFGQSVALSATGTVIGAPGDTSGGNKSAGSAYLYDPSARGLHLRATLWNPINISYGDYGYSVAIDAATVVVGAPDCATACSGAVGSGTADVFSASTGALTSALVSPTPLTGGEFGASVATNGATVVVGAPDEPAVDDMGAGNVYVFDALTGLIQDHYYGPAQHVGGQFGWSVAEDANRVVAGAPEQGGPPYGPGSAFVLTLETPPLEPAADYRATLMGVYYDRADLQAAFPNVTSNFSEYEQLVNWAGEVVSGAFPDASAATLAPYGYYYTLMLVYDHRADLQAAFPNAYNSSASYEGLLSWAKNVVLHAPADPSYSILLPFATYYEELG